jgi:cell division protein FtsB
MLTESRHAEEPDSPLAQNVREWGHALLRWRRRLATLAFFLLAVWLAFGVMSGPNGWMAYRNKKIENRRLQQEVQQMEAENEALQRRVNALKTDPRAIEREAREQLRYAKPGEIIYVMPENAPAPSPTPNGLVQNK